MNKYFYQTTLSWDAHAYEPSGEFLCQAKSVKYDMVEVRAWSRNKTFAKFSVFRSLDGNCDGQRSETIPDIYMSQMHTVTSVWKY